jgi:formyl-CoA transferase
MDAALRDMRVLDLTQYEAGPSCTQFLAWLGATVVKIEPPAGDPARATESGDEDSIYFLTFNSNKRSVVLDLQREEGRDIFLRLAARFDVVAENFSLGTMERLGLGYDTLKSVNPGLIYATIKGFGTSGPYSSYKSYDMVAQAAGGAFSVTGEADGPPMRPGATFADTGSGMLGAMGIMAAYIQRLRTGEGQAVEVSMQETIVNFMRTRLAQRERQAGPILRRGNVTFPPTNLYPCAPGGPNDWVYIHIMTSKQWDTLLIALDRTDLMVDPRFSSQEARTQHGSELYAEIAAWTSRRSKAEAMQHLASGGVPCSAVLDTEDILADQHLRERGAIVGVDHPVRGRWDFASCPVRLSGSTAPLARAPLLGEDTEAVLAAELGLSADELRRLEEAQVTAHRREGRLAGGQS